MRLVDVFVVARSIVSEYKTLNQGTAEIPMKVLGAAGLVSVISNQTGLKINTACIRWPGHMFRAQLRRYADRADIIYSHDLNVCWSRFVICKEAFHLSFGDGKNYSSDPVTLVNGLLNQVPQFAIDEDIEEIAAEYLAVVGALELLIPQECADLLDRMKKDGLSNYEIANTFRIPEKLISLRLSPNIEAMAKKFHGEMPS